MTTVRWKYAKGVLWSIAAILVLLWAGKTVAEYFLIILVFIAYFTLVYNVGTLVAASLFHIKVEEISVGFGKRILGFQFAHVQFNLGLLMVGGSCRLADYSAFPGLNPMRDEFRAAKFIHRIIVHAAGSLTLLILSVFLLGIEDFAHCISSTLSDIVSYILLIDNKVGALNPFTWRRLAGNFSTWYALVNLLPVTGLAGDRLVRTFLYEYFDDSHVSIRSYTIVRYVLTGICLISFLVHVFNDMTR